MQKFSLITGAAGLLGQYHALALLELGHNLVLTDINLKKLNKLKFFLKKKHPKKIIYFLKMDVTSESSIKSIKKKLNKQGGIVNNLINNAAIDAKIKRNKNNEFDNFNVNQWNKEVNVGLTGAMLCSKVFGSYMVKENIKGSIINIASDLSVIAPNQSIYKIRNKKNNFIKPVTYSVIKHGIIGLTKYLASYWGRKKIKVNSLSPGSVLNDQSSILQKKLKEQIPMFRLAKKNEYIGVIKFLSSDDSDYMTGQNIIMDGGRSIW
jgi:NAD(P)-dependent dehydrogenase (short-subunit alcohol dehydrogenase family)